MCFLLCWQEYTFCQCVSSSGQKPYPGVSTVNCSTTTAFFAVMFIIITRNGKRFSFTGMANGVGYDALRTAPYRDLSTPSIEHVHLWPANYRLQNVCICWRSSNHACWWRLAGSGRGAEQENGNYRWTPPDLEAKAHFVNILANKQSFYNGV